MANGGGSGTGGGPIWSDLRDLAALRDKRSLLRRLRDWVAVEPETPVWIPNVPLIDPESDRVGICCSGGGIRSAAYNLGALQVLREEGILDEAAYVTAVSGGSYIASAYATVAHRSPPAPDEKPVYAPGSPEEEFLRNHSSYLAPGLGGKARLLLRVLLGMAVNLLLVAVAVGLLTLPLGWLTRLSYPQLASAQKSGGLDLQTWMWAIPVGFASVGLLTAVPDLIFALPNDDIRRRLEAWTTRLIGAAVCLAVILLLLPQLILLAREVSHVTPEQALYKIGVAKAEAAKQQASAKATGLFQLVNLGAVAAAVAGALRAFVARKRSFFVLAAAAVAGPLAVVSFALWVFNESASLGPHDTSMVIWFGILLGLAALLWLFADLTQWSLHPFYRRRLSSAFFVGRSGESVAGEGREAAEIPYTQTVKLSELEPNEAFKPELVVCAAANVSDEGATPPGRAATTFTFSRQEIGGPIGALPTDKFEQAAESALRAITLPAAVAMSGAAVSPAMGKKTIRAMSFLLGLTNVRLGVWVPNPRLVADLERSRFSPLTRRLPRGLQGFLSRSWRSIRGADGSKRAGRLDRINRRRATPVYLFKELLGLTSVKDRFLYITDGGHFENLGLVELLRRGCTTIFCLDAGGDRGGTYPALGEAVALARSELQVEIEVDPTPIRPNEERISETDWVVGRYRFRATRGSLASDDGNAAPWSGELIYCRAAVTADAPWDVRAFHESDKRFPYHSTFDQLFNDQKFESYRALGAHTARRAAVAHRQRLLRVRLRTVLEQTARERTTITPAQLEASLELPTGSTELAAAIAEVREEESAAGRPSLAILIQPDGAIDADTQSLLDLVHEYWSATPDP
jgi:hypothetical protein